MALFARKSRSGNWDNVTDQTLEDLTFPSDVLADVLDGENEVSVWEVEDPPGPALDQIAAALHTQTANNLSEMTFRFISDWCVKTKLGLTMRKTPGISLDTKLNSGGTHWIIQISTVGDAIRLAKAFKERESLSFTRADIMRRFAASLQAKRIPPEKVMPGLWKKLIDEAWVQIAAPPS
jgi:hypothetical protein